MNRVLTIIQFNNKPKKITTQLINRIISLVIIKLQQSQLLIMSTFLGIEINKEKFKINKSKNIKSSYNFRFKNKENKSIEFIKINQLSRVLFINSRNNIKLQLMQIEQQIKNFCSNSTLINFNNKLIINKMANLSKYQKDCNQEILK